MLFCHLGTKSGADPVYALSVLSLDLYWVFYSLLIVSAQTVLHISNNLVCLLIGIC